MTTVRRNVLRVAGVACLVALGGGRSFAQSGAQETPEPNVELKRYPLPHAQEALRRELREAAGRLDDLEKELKALRAEVRALTTELHARRDARGPAVADEAPASVPAVPPADDAPEPENGGKNAPTVFRLNCAGVPGSGLLMVVSPDGHKVVVSDTKRSFPKTIKLSEGKAPRRRVSPVFDNSGGVVALAVHGPKITRLAVLAFEDATGRGLSSETYAWYPIDLREPVEEATPVVQDYLSALYTLGRRVYAFSRPARRWDVLELPKGADPVHGFDNEGPTVENDGHLYTFVLSTGKWSDLDLRAILDKP